MSNINDNYKAVDLEKNVESQVSSTNSINEAICKHCKTMIAPNAKFCPNCGNQNVSICQVTIAGPWRRWVARIIDLYLDIYIIAFCVGILSAFIPLFEHLSSILTRGDSYGLIFLLTPFALLLDCAIYSIFKNTLGKWLMGVKAIEPNMLPISKTRYLKRNLMVYWYGLGINFPIVNFFTLNAQYNRVNKGYPTSYDEKMHITVIANKSRWYKTILGVVLLLVTIPFTYTNTGDNAIEQNNLGIKYFSGDGVQQDYQEAVRLFELSAEQGYSTAQYNLGYCYENGYGVKLDYVKAVEYYTLAAEQGAAEAQYSLAICYYNGTGVRQDYNEAVKLIRLSAEQGHEQAIEALRDLGI